jgi:hypothetical protein
MRWRCCDGSAGSATKPRTLTLGEAGQLSGSFHAGYPQLILVAKAAGWSVAVEANGWEGTRPEVLRALSRGTQAVSVHHNGSKGYFNDAVDGQVLVSFELLFPQRRWGSQPDLLLPQMRAVGLDPDWQRPPHGDLVTGALALAERVTGLHLDPRVLDGPLAGAAIAPLLDDPPASFFVLGGEDDAEVAAAIDQAAPGVLRRAAATAARHAVQLAQLDHDAVVVEALAAAQAGQARQVHDHSPLGWRIRTWAVEARIADRVRNDPRASLDAQRIEANLLRAAGRAAEQPLKDPSPWLGHSGSALLLRWRAGQAVRAALFADPRTALYATLEKLRYLPGDPWMAIRAAALEVLRSGSTAGPPDASDQ